MATPDKKKGKDNPVKKGTVEEASKVLEESQKAGEGAGEDKPEEEQGEDQENKGDGKDGGESKEGQEGGAGEDKGDEGDNDEGKGEGEEKGDEDLEEEDPKKEEIPTPVPNAEQIEHSAAFMAENPDLLEACRQTVARAEQIIAEREKGPKKSAEELAGENHARLVKTYGKDFVTAAKGNNRGYYSRAAWNQMKNKRGWVEVTETMPELQAGQTEDPLDHSDAE